MNQILLNFTALVLFSFFSNATFGQQCHFNQVSSKSGHSLGISTEGKIYSWGVNSQGQLGLGNTSLSVLSPQLVNQDSDWKKVETGNSSYFSAALKNNGSLWLWGGNFNNALGTHSTLLLPTPITQSFNWKDFSTGYFRIMAIRDDNTLWGWGENGGGCLGLPISSNYVLSPTQIGSDNNWAKISCGLYHSLALRSNGTVWVSGYNNVGQLGNGSSGIGTFSDAFIQVGNENDWTEILAAAGFCLAIKSNGTLWAWGLNEDGQLGDGTTTIRLVPTQIGTDTDWKFVAYSGFSCAAIKTNGTLWTWGYGAQGQLGNGSNTSNLVPTQVGTNTDWLEVSGGGGLGFTGTTNDHYLGLKTNKELFSWGVNVGGGLGNNTTTDVNTPTSICNTVSSVEIVDQDNVLVFPNPTTHLINVESDTQIKSLTVIDVFGQEIKEHTRSKQVDVFDFNNGTYFLKIEMLDGRYVTKVFSIIK